MITSIINSGCYNVNIIIIIIANIMVVLVIMIIVMIIYHDMKLHWRWW